jgi:hypothetical protein
LADEDSIRARIDVLRSFPVVRGLSASSATVLEMEVTCELLRAIGRTVPTLDQLRERLFPRIDIDDVVEDIVAFRRASRWARSAMTSSADARNYSQQAETQQRQHTSQEQSARSSVPLRYKLVAMMTRYAIYGLTKIVPRLTPLRELVDGGPQRKKVNHTSILMSVMGVTDLGMPKDFPEEDFVPIYMFHQEVKRILRSIRSEDVESGQHHNLLQQISPYSCLGYSLQMAVKRARMRQPKPYIVSDEVDADHIIFSPYVDCMFVDKRTLEFVRQEVRRGSTLPHGAGANLKRNGPLSAVLDAVTRRQAD